MTREEIIEALEKVCDLFEEIQRRKAVLEAERILAIKVGDYTFKELAEKALKE